MSENMLSDDNLMNKWNPLVQEDALSGSTRRAGDPAEYTADTEDVGWLVPDQERSIACERTRTMGDKTVDYCADRPMCDPKRALEPHRNIDFGFEDSLARSKIRGPRYVGSSTRIVGQVARHYREEIMLLLLVIALLVYLSRR